MGIWGSFTQGILEIGMNLLMGIETLGYLLYDKPNLVKTIFDKIGEIVYESYKKIIGLDKLIGFFQGDDMGFKTSTLFSPQVLRKYILPWHKKLAELAHKHQLLYILHSCGNVEPIDDPGNIVN